MKIPGTRLLKKAERAGNAVEVPLAKKLGLVDFLKLTFKEVNDDHVMAFAGNLTYKGLFAISRSSPSFCRFWGYSTPRTSCRPSSTASPGSRRRPPSPFSKSS